MRELYVCDTPYQVMNALNIAYHREQKAEKTLFLVNQFRTAETVFGKILETKQFDHAYLLRRDETKFMPVGMKRYSLVMLDYLTPKRFLKARLQGKKAPVTGYDVVYASGAFSVVTAVMKLNPKAEFVLYDDGVGSYIGDNVMRGGGTLNRLFSKVFHVGAYACKPSKLLVNNVSMCQSTVVPKNRILPLPAIDAEFVSFCNGIFETCGDKKNTVYWLSQPIDSVPGAVEARERVYSCLYPYRDKITVRMHPRDLAYDFYQAFTVDRGTDMWELTVQGIPTDDLILIGGYSSAQINLKMLFDMEPTLIFVYAFNKQLEEDKIQATKEQIENIRSIYRNPDKIYVPTTVEELTEVLHKVI